MNQDENLARTVSEAADLPLPPPGGEVVSTRMVAYQAEQAIMRGLAQVFSDDEDNPRGEEKFVFKDGKLVEKPKDVSEAQAKTVALVGNWIQGDHVLTRTEVSAILTQIRGLTRHGGYSTSRIPMTCTGPICPLVQDSLTAKYDRSIDEFERSGGTLPNPGERPEPDLSRCRCQLYAAGVAPLGKPCSLEIMQDVTLRHSLCEALGVDESATIHIHLINSLAIWTILQNRILVELGQDPFLLKETDVGAYAKGNVVYVLKGKIEHPLLGALEKVQDRIDRIRKQLLATPEAQARVSLRGLGARPQHMVDSSVQRSEALETSTTSLETLIGDGDGQG